MSNIIKETYPTNIYEIDNIYFYIDPLWKNIAISVSGGADSALLAYLLCDIITKNNLEISIHIISNIRMWKTRPWQRYDSLRVFNYLKNTFTNLSFTRHENFIAPEIEYGSIGPSIKDRNGNMKSGDQITIRSHAEYICHTYKISAWFAGLTANPNLAKITKGMPDRNIKFENTAEDLKLLINIVDGIYVCHPFRFISKDWIVRKYQEYNILNLFEQTRSCEGEFKNINYLNYTPNMSVPTCEECFWCQERKWAIEHL